MNEKNKDIELKIYSIATSLTESIIFLDETKGSRIIPIWIGPMEAQAIAIMLSGYPSPRPMTHDLIYSILAALKSKIIKVQISNISKNTYYANIYLKTSSGEEKIIDSRPSDAIALAVRYGCPICINSDVLAKIQFLNKPISYDDVEKFKHDLKNLTPKDIINQLLKKNKPKPQDKEDNKDNDKNKEENDK